ncbi:MAG: hypothetical protein LJD31_03640 [Wolbachia endosymbiont of Menacanthus eurysternus]|nr:hypothetical protein [Wolbachia endosymbiont of Menacanthus eurysternus]
MKNIFNNKTNAPYLVSGALAIGTLLASGVFAVAPYVGFLAPVAALSVGLPFIIGGAIFSAVVIALSAVVINKNNTISEQKAQLTEKEKDKNFQIASQEEIILKCMKEISEKDAVIRAQEQEISKQKKGVNVNYLDLATFSRKQEKQANSLDYLNIDNVSKQFDLSNIEAAKEYLKSL